MVNNRNLEYQLLKKSNITSRAPQSVVDAKDHIMDLENCDCGCKKTTS